MATYSLILVVKVENYESASAESINWYLTGKLGKVAGDWPHLSLLEMILASK
jgi:hypothetical protein